MPIARGRGWGRPCVSELVRLVSHIEELKMPQKQSKVAKKNKAKGSPAKAAASPKKAKAESSNDDDSL